MSKTNPSSPVTVVFLPSGRRGVFSRGISILDAARQLDEPIESICGGRLACGKCQVQIETGAFARLGVRSGPEHVSPITDQERAWLENQPSSPTLLRLACNARILDDVVVFVPEHARIHQQVVRKDATVRVIQVAPTIRQVYVELEPPAMAERQSDWERLRRALVEQWGLNPAELEPAPALLRKLQDELRAGEWKVTVILWRENRVMDLRAGYQEGIWGLAVDVGSTTIAAYLCDLQTGDLLASDATMNPQITYGEDLMSRISYATGNADGLKKLHGSVLKAFRRLASSVARQAGILTVDIHEAVVVGNTTMINLFLGIPPKYLGEAPFALARREAQDWPAAELNLRLHPAANLHIPPAVAGHVGADHVAALLAAEPYEQPGVTLLVDVGTNAEIALWDGRQLYSASSPTGPAFEGAQISHGMRAAPGAIERVRIDRETGAVRYKIIGEERWSDAWTPDQPPALSPTGICGSGVIEAIAEMFLAGVLLADGRFNPRIEHPRIHWQGKRARFTLATEEEVASGHPIVITQEDVRAVQLAKAALYAGCKTLMHEAGVEKLDRVLLAGAFGSYIDPFHALVLGLVPDAPLEEVQAVGNAAGDGARIALLNRERRRAAQQLARSVRYVETAANDFFQDAFIAAIAIPHQHDSFPHIARWLPEPVVRPRGRARRSRRRTK